MMIQITMTGTMWKRCDRQMNRQICHLTIWYAYWYTSRHNISIFQCIITALTGIYLIHTMPKALPETIISHHENRTWLIYNSLALSWHRLMIFILTWTRYVIYLCITLWWCNMREIAAQNSDNLAVFPNVCWKNQCRKIPMLPLLAFKRGIHQWLVDSPHKGQVM